jgi:Malectin domain
MKSLILILTMATNAIAFEQIYAINAGGNAHTDSDGIQYRGVCEKDGSDDDFDIGGVPQPDRHIYQTFNYFQSTDNKMKIININIPMKMDGLYAMIAKFSALSNKDAELNMKLNDIHLLTNVTQINQCGGEMKSCDVYFYFCVANKMLYYNEKSTAVQDDSVKVTFTATNGKPVYAGLVMLRGKLGERQKLISSNTKESLYFDPLKVNVKCSNLKVTPIKPDRDMCLDHMSTLNVSIESSFQSVRTANENTLETVKRLQEGQNENFGKLLNSTAFFSENSLKKIMKTAIESTFEAVRRDNEDNLAQIRREIQTLQNETTKNSQKMDECSHKCTSIGSLVNQCSPPTDIKRIEEITLEQAIVKKQIAEMIAKLEVIHKLLIDRTDDTEPTIDPADMRSSF